jgi:putative ABC transport system permease protein
VIDVSGIMRQLQDVLDQVVTAVEFLFLFTLASGVLVLYAALMGSQDERTREAGLLRALGATRGSCRRRSGSSSRWWAALSGLLAASGAAALGWALATYQFKFEWHFSPSVWAAGLVVGALCARSPAAGWACAMCCGSRRCRRCARLDALGRAPRYAAMVCNSCCSSRNCA